MPDDHDYEAGLRDGRLKSLERDMRETNNRIDHHERRLAIMERILFGLIGALFLIQFLPTLQALKELFR